MKNKLTLILLVVHTHLFAQFSSGKFISPELAEINFIAIADVNADGSNDVIAASEYYRKVVWYPNDGTGSFGTSILISKRFNSITSVQVGDVNRDTRVDVILTDSGGDLVYYINDGTGIFGEEVVLDTDVGSVTDFNLVDINQDGNLDILLTSFWKKNVWYYLNNSLTESWEKVIVADNVKGVIDAQVGDIDNDGDMDVVSVSALDNQIGWHENIGGDAFSNFHLLTEYVDYPNSVIVADFDGNQLVDIGFVPKQDEGEKIFWLPNLGNSGFGEPRQILNTTREAISISDVDLDGDMDILSGGMIVYNMDGMGTFQASEYISEYSRSLLTVGELNGDGYLDVLLANADYADSQIFWHANIEGGMDYGERQNISYTADQPRSIYFADLNQDGKMDIVSTSYEDGKVAWYPNNNNNFEEQIVLTDEVGFVNDVVFTDVDGNSTIDVLIVGLKIAAWFSNELEGGFSDMKIIDDKANNNGIAVADLDEDGKKDILITSYINSEDLGELRYYRNDGSNNFEDYQVMLEEQAAIYGLKTLDYEGDGDVDIFYYSAVHKEVSLVRNNGGGDFYLFPIRIIGIETGESLTTFFLEDIDGDEDLDLFGYLYRSQGENEMVWLERTGAGSFDNTFRSIDIVDNANAFNIKLSDYNNDGHKDIVLLEHAGKILWYANDGYGHFDNFREVEIEQLEFSGNSNADYPFAFDVADLDGDGDQDITTAYYHYDYLVFYESLRSNSQINVFTFNDLNENGLREDEEPSVFNMPVEITPNVSVVEYFNLQEYTAYYLEPSQYTVSFTENGLWESSIENQSYNIEVIKDGEQHEIEFGLKPKRILPRMELYLNSNPTRCNVSTSYWLTYKNTGTTVFRGIVSLEMDEMMGGFVANPAPDFVEGNTIFWRFDELYPTHSTQIKIQIQMPDFNSMGEILRTKATVELFNNSDDLVFAKSTNYNSELLCSYDPNDKLARSNLLGQSEFAYIADTIQYTVRFQNTGNDTAFNIRIEDVLDKKLDWATFHPITASHDYRTELNRETGLITFYFDDILLPDSTTNEPESHGFVMFGIASKPELEDKTDVENTASIFFDFNPPIITNTAVLTLIEGVETNIEDSLLDNGYWILVRPNPFSDYTTIEVSGLPQGVHQLEVRDILGRKVRELRLEKGKAVLQRGNLESGLYLVRIVEEDNEVILGGGKVLVE